MSVVVNDRMMTARISTSDNLQDLVNDSPGQFGSLQLIMDTARYGMSYQGMWFEFTVGSEYKYLKLNKEDAIELAKAIHEFVTRS